MATLPLPRPPVPIDRVFEDPSVVEALLRDHQPYWPVQRYASTNAEYATLSGSRTASAPIIAPVFRGDWARGGEVGDGVEPLLHHEPFVEAARRLFDAEIVRPHTVYVNLTWQLPFEQGRGHTDIPAFRGFDRSTVPIAFLTLLGQSGLFEAERVKTATAVAWFYEGDDGGFEYWPAGPAAPSEVHQAGIHNTAIVGDNDFMWHRVRPTGRPEDGMVTLTLDDELRTDDGHAWWIESAGERLAEFDRSRVRVSLSWKADAFVDDDDRRRHDEHLDDLDLPEVLRRLSEDLEARGIDPTPPDPEDPFHDDGYLDRLIQAYMRYPASGRGRKSAT
jgi:hypothetical protein